MIKSTWKNQTGSFHFHDLMLFCSSVCISVYLSLCLSVCLSICLYVCLSVLSLIPKWHKYTNEHIIKGYRRKSFTYKTTPVKKNVHVKIVTKQVETWRRFMRKTDEKEDRFLFSQLVTYFMCFGSKIKPPMNKWELIWIRSLARFSKVNESKAVTQSWISIFLKQGDVGGGGWMVIVNYFL